MASTKTLLLVGSGPGIGLSVAKIYAKKGFGKIALISRTLGRLQEEQKAVAATASGVEVKIWAVDVAQKASLITALKEVVSWANGKLDVVVYNAARVNQVAFFGLDDDQTISDLRIATLGLNTTMEYTHEALTGSHPAFYVTTSRIAQDPWENLYTLSLIKASQLSLTLSFKKAFPKIHVAPVYVNGVVGDDKGLIKADDVGAAFWALWEDPAGKWRADADVNVPGQ